jgi:hypothetical protein
MTFFFESKYLMAWSTSTGVPREVDLRRENHSIRWAYFVMGSFGACPVQSELAHSLVDTATRDLGFS